MRHRDFLKVVGFGAVSLAMTGSMAGSEQPTPISKANKRPNFIFILYLSHHSVHIPLEAPPELIEKYEKKSKPAGGVNNPDYDSARADEWKPRPRT